ncbi:hypothetical protein I312_105318 [Cryptococcus bacillisporus CA1280]|uniref:uncharacterized protein n=1 Tax=Cryptococcus bacillisporus CA1280 TaxID=1296109 RepID=UPI003365CD4F
MLEMMEQRAIHPAKNIVSYLKMNSRTKRRMSMMTSWMKKFPYNNSGYHRHCHKASYNHRVRKFPRRFQFL